MAEVQCPKCGFRMAVRKTATALIESTLIDPPSKCVNGHQPTRCLDLKPKIREAWKLIADRAA